jgi:hypothetical protein
MIGALAAKEWQQHRFTFLLLAGFTLGLTALIGVTVNLRAVAGSVFAGLLTVVRFIVPLGAIVLSQRLVALEFREKTQLFLESLPIPRWCLITVKYAVGLIALLIVVLGALALTAFFGRHSELLTPRFLCILAVRAAGWSWFVFGFVFVTGFLGRYRLIFFVALGAAYGIADHYTDLRPERFGPFALVDGRFPYESTSFPIDALKTTAAVATALLGLAFLLGLVREGTVGALLGEKMSHREKMFIGAVAVTASVGFVVIGARAEPSPFDLPGATEESRGEVVVKVGISDETERARGVALAGRAADELAALREFLGLAALPPVFIVARSDFAAGQFERVKLEKTDGVVVRANFVAPKFSEREFLDWLMRQVLLTRSRERLDRESRRWVLDGFTAWWKERAEPAVAADFPAGAVRAAEKGFTAGDVAAWLSFSRRVGADDAKAVAWVGLRTLTRRHGAEACRRFLHDVLAPEVTLDARATFHDWLHPVNRSLEAAAGVPFSRFFAEWQEELATLRTPPPAHP